MDEFKESTLDNSSLNSEDIEFNVNESNSITGSVCENCGAILTEEQDFCPKCGTRRGVTKRICPKCATVLTNEQEFCPKCGHKVDNSAETSNTGGKKKLIVIIVTVLIIALFGVAASKILPLVFMDYEGYMERGNYVKAYEKAKTDDEKLIVVCENAAMFESGAAVDSLKDPSSFVLREGYLLKKKDTDGKYSYRLVLHISGNNSWGASVSSYWLYVFNGKKGEWEYWNSISDFEEEDFDSWDDYDDKLEKTINNLCRDYIKETINAGVKMSKDGVNRVNLKFEEDTLDEVELLDVYSDADSGEL